MLKKVFLLMVFLGSVFTLYLLNFIQNVKIIKNNEEDTKKSRYIHNFHHGTGLEKSVDTSGKFCSHKYYEFSNIHHNNGNFLPEGFSHNIAENLLSHSNSSWITDIRCGLWTRLKKLDNMGYKIVIVDTYENIQKANVEFGNDFHNSVMIPQTDLSVVIYSNFTSLYEHNLINSIKVMIDSSKVKSILLAVDHNLSDNEKMNLNNLGNYLTQEIEQSVHLNVSNHKSQSSVILGHRKHEFKMDYFSQISLVITTSNGMNSTTKLIEKIRSKNITFPIVIADIGKSNDCYTCDDNYYCDACIKASSVLQSRMESLHSVRTQYVFMFTENFTIDMNTTQLHLLRDNITYTNPVVAAHYSPNMNLGLLNGFMAKTRFLHHLWHTAVTTSHTKQKSISHESSEKVLFYMYNQSALTMNNWDKICIQWESADIQLLRLLKKHPWRTDDPSKAKVFVIPTPAFQSFRCGGDHKTRIETALNSLINNTLFNAGQRHVIMGHNWKFDYKYRGMIIPPGWLEHLQNVTMARFEYYGMSQWENFYKYYPRKPKTLFGLQHETTKFTIVTPYSVYIPLVEPDFKQWIKRPNLIWYHVKSGNFFHGGSYLRHLPLKANLSGSVGNELPKEKWKKGWSESKFCLCLFGDTPTSHSFYNSIAGGCIPVVISDNFNVGIPFDIYIEEFSVVIKESDFRKSPQIDIKLEAIPEYIIKKRLNALAIAQRKLIIGHPKSRVGDLFLTQLHKMFSENADEGIF